MKCFLLLFTLFPCYLSATLYEGVKPNIIVILTDDQGSIDLNTYGAKDLYTPNIDKLASSGVQFSQFYSAAPLCSPSRAALLTGLTPQGAGLPTNASSTKGAKGMPGNKTTMAETFKRLDYKTAHIGKWHLGFSPDTMPLAQGFDYSFGHMGGAIDNFSHFFYWSGSNRHDLYENEQEVWHDGHYFPDLMNQKAINFIEDNQETPFFLYYAINSPHYPVQPKQKWREFYKDLPMPRRDYAAFISTVDENVGALISSLEKNNLRDNTIIIFQSDHGHSLESRAFGGGSSGIFRGAKTSLFEGGIRVPAIISYPNKIDKNQLRDQMAVGVDWLPTLLEYLNQPIPPLDGKSLKNVIDNNDDSPHAEYYWKQGITWAIRRGDWKLIGYPHDPQNKIPLTAGKDDLFLANIKNNPSETINYAEQHSEITQQLLSNYLTWKFSDPSDIPSQQEEIRSIANKSKVTLQFQPSEKYREAGAMSLVDEKLGSRQFTTGNWLGFEKNDLNAIIDLGSIKNFDQLIIGSLQNTDSWIFHPPYIEASWSVDGKNYTPPIRIHNSLIENDTQILINRNKIFKENSHARYIKVTAKNIEKCPPWHKGNGKNAFLFIDEISVL